MASKFTEETRQIIFEALRENPSVPSAASKAGVSPGTLRSWLRRGEGGDPEFADFALDCAEARRFMKDEIVKALFQTATDSLHPQQTRAAHQLLSTLYPAEFADVKHKVQHERPKESELDLSHLSTEETRMLHRLLKKALNPDNTDVTEVLPGEERR